MTTLPNTGKYWAETCQNKTEKDKIEAHCRKNGQLFAGTTIFLYLCTVQWNEGLDKAPHFHFNYPYMIDKNIVKQLVGEWLEGKDYFLVDVQISPDNKIVVEIDHSDGVWIEDCVELSKYIEDRLDRDKEDFELEVGSAGLGQPFKVPQQYVNFIGKEVEVLDKEGKKHKGILKSVDGNDFTVTVKEKVRQEGKKRPILTDVDIDFQMDQVKYTKYIINFK